MAGTLNGLNKLDAGYAELKTVLEASKFFEETDKAYKAAAKLNNRSLPDRFTFTMTHKQIVGDVAYQANPTDKFTTEEIKMANDYLTFCLVERGANVTLSLSNNSTLMTFNVIELSHGNVAETLDTAIENRETLNNYVEFPAPGWNR